MNRPEKPWNPDHAAAQLEGMELIYRRSADDEAMRADYWQARCSELRTELAEVERRATVKAIRRCLEICERSSTRLYAAHQIRALLEPDE